MITIGINNNIYHKSLINELLEIFIFKLSFNLVSNLTYLNSGMDETLYSNLY